MATVIYFGKFKLLPSDFGGFRNFGSFGNWVVDPDKTKKIKASLNNDDRKNSLHGPMHFIYKKNVISIKKFNFLSPFHFLTILRIKLSKTFYFF